MQLYDYTKPTPLLVRAIQGAAPGRALDTGCYSGRHALYLARLGWDVTAIDIDQDALGYLRKDAEVEGLPIIIHAADVRDYEPDMPFDLVLSSMVLNFLPGGDIAAAIARMQLWTKPQGLNVVSVYTTAKPPGERPYLFLPNSLRDHYEDWNILEYKEDYGNLVIPDGKTEPERNVIASLIAERPDKS